MTRPGGRVVAAAISRFAGPLDFVSTARLDARSLAEARKLLTDGRNDPSIGFTHAFFHRPAELADEFGAAGLTTVEVHGVEGPACPRSPSRRPAPRRPSGGSGPG